MKILLYVYPVQGWKNSLTGKKYLQISDKELVSGLCKELSKCIDLKSK